MSEPAVKFEPEQLHEIKFADDAGVNTSDEVIMEQVAQNIRRGLPQAKPQDPNDYIVLLTCGGPSLATHEKQLVEAYWKGGKVVATNASYQWCIDRNIRPSAMVMLDAREFNARFVETPVPNCKYLLASQCHPRAFDLCRDREVIIWHACSAGEKELALLNEYYFEQTHPVTLGTTVGIRAISLFRMLGFMRFEIFGMDSCWLDNQHHAYSQPENQDKRFPVWLRPKDHDELAKRFICAPWHMKQAQDFMQLVKERGDMFQLQVHGPGLIAEIVRTGAELPELPADTNGPQVA